VYQALSKLNEYGVYVFLGFHSEDFVFTVIAFRFHSSVTADGVCIVLSDHVPINLLSSVPKAMDSLASALGSFDDWLPMEWFGGHGYD